MYGLSDQLGRLSPAEEQVLLAVWAACPPITRAEIARCLPKTPKPWADATLLNFLYRLERKGWVRRGKQGNCNTYTPCVTRRAYGVYVMRQRLDSLFDGDLAAAVQALVSESGAGVVQLEQARNVIAEKLAAAEEYDFYDPYG